MRLCAKMAARPPKEALLQTCERNFLSLSHRGGAFYLRGYEPVLALLLFASTSALHSRQLDLKLRLDYLWVAQVSHSHTSSLSTSAEVE